ncbi:unnamed protein product [Chironomus riparius]|uniref:Uncharacterized protein n=1 Tax=Chironomus riparius TaxID=315576 RepID=A0A9N9RJJ5_9DIPT|nr:unnamed protein product [Chironomus riparius]
MILEAGIMNFLSKTLIALLLLSRTVDARGGGRGAGRGGFRGRGSGLHRGGGGYGSYGIFQNSASTVSSGTYSDPWPSAYGTTFDDNGPPEDSYIYNNFYKDWDSNKFLINSLFYGVGMKKTGPEETKKNYDSIGLEDFYRRWNDEQDKEWRTSTRAPYFENKIPGDQKLFPASAVVGAATAFGLVSLLPLNVPTGKPLMYCGTTNLIQSSIRINDIDNYVCRKRTLFKVTCKTDYQKKLEDKCEMKEVECDLDDKVSRKFYCIHGTLLSTMSIFCNSTTSVHKNKLNKQSIIKCYEGQLPKSQTSFIPTTTSTTEFPITSTTPKPLSLSANVHILLLKLMGKSDVLEPETYLSSESNAWRPIALQFPPETTTEKVKTTTTRVPYVWMEIVFDNSTGVTSYQPISKHLNEDPTYISSNLFKVYTTSTEPYVETTTKSMTTTQIPYIWMSKSAATDKNREPLLVPVPESMIEVAELFNYYPKSWVKVPVTKNDDTTTTKS